MRSVLIVDDDEAVRSATTILLNANGFEVVAVGDGNAGIEAIKGRHFDVVIVDLFMRGMNGLETTRGIRKYDAKIPIIAASGFMLDGTCSNGSRSGRDCNNVQTVPAKDRLADDTGCANELSSMTGRSWRAQNSRNRPD